MGKRPWWTRVSGGGGRRTDGLDRVGQCIDHSGAGEAYLPLLDAQGRPSRGPAGARLVACVRQYAPTWLGQLAAVVGEEERGPSCIRRTG